MIRPTIDDLPTHKKSCATCTYRGIDCPRMNKRYPQGYVKNTLTGETGGMIACCQNYEGKFK